MKALNGIIRGTFSKLLKGYPRGFRAEFEEEMLVTFEEQTRDAAYRGTLALLAAWLMEMSILPFSILRECWHEARGRDMMIAENTGRPAQAVRKGTWHEMVLAALPHLLFTVFVGRAAFMEIMGDADNWFNIYIGLPMLVGFFAVLFYAWRGGWPLWSTSWFGYWIWAWSMGVLYLLTTINTRLHLVADWTVAYIGIVLMFVLLVVGLFALFRADKLRGLLAMAFIMPIAMPFTLMEFVPNQIEGMLTLGSGLAAALAAAWIIRTRDWRSALAVTLGLDLLLAIPFAYVQAYKLEYPGFWSSTPQPSDFYTALLIFFLGCVALAGVPLLFWRAWDAGRRRAA